MGAVNARTRIMMYQSLALILVFSTCGVFAQFKCENHTLPDGTYCPDDGQIDHTYADPEHCSRFWDCYNGCMTHMQCQQDYLYDIPHGWCDEPHKVTCGDRDPDDRPCKDCGPGPEPPFFLIVRLLEVMDFMLMIKIAESISNVLVGFLIFILATLDYCIDQVTFNVITQIVSTVEIDLYVMIMMKTVKTII